MNGQYPMQYGYQQGYQSGYPQQFAYTPTPYDPLANNIQRQQQILQNNPQLAAQYQMNVPQQPQQPLQAAILKGRAVSGMDEAKAAQIDFDGSVHVFTDIPNGRIYTKQIGINGAAVFNTYALQEPEPIPNPASMTVDPDEVSELRAKIAEIETKLNNMGGTANVQFATNNGAVRNASKQRKSDGDDAASGGE